MKLEDFKKIICPKCAYVKSCGAICEAGTALMQLATGVYEAHARIKTELATLYKQ